jgi:syntaxin 16
MWRKEVPNIFDDNVKTIEHSHVYLLVKNKTNFKVAFCPETEINHIVKSIQDLNDLFKDIAVMVEDQGPIVDRIDYNIEKVSSSVQQGLTELEKASKYQKTSRKMYLIAFLIYDGFVNT